MRLCALAPCGEFFDVVSCAKFICNYFLSIIMESSHQPIQSIQRDLRQVKTEIDQIKNDIRFIKIVLQSKAEIKKLQQAPVKSQSSWWWSG